MAIVDLENIKGKFEAGDSPGRQDYIDMIDTLAALPEPTAAAPDSDQAVISMQVFG
jgi:hypothetical protein